MRHLFFQTSTDSSSLFKESMWITSPPHRSVSYSPWCLFFSFFLLGGGWGFLVFLYMWKDWFCMWLLPATWSSSSSSSQKLNPQSLLLLLLLLLLEKEVAKTKTQKQEKTQPVPAHTLLKPSMLQLVNSLLHAPSIQRRENFASYVCIFFCVFWGWYTKPEKLMQNSSCKDGEEANRECAKLRKALFFPQETRKKSSKEKRETQTIPAFTIPLHTLLCQALKSVSTTNQKPKSIKWKAWNCCQKLESCLYNKPETKKINQIKAWNRCKKLDICLYNNQKQINPIKAWNFVCKRKAWILFWQHN